MNKYNYLMLNFIKIHIFNENCKLNLINNQYNDYKYS